MIDATKIFVLFCKNLVKEYWSQTVIAKDTEIIDKKMHK